MFKSLNPYTQEISYLAEFQSDVQIGLVLDELHLGFLAWKNHSIEQKKSWLVSLKHLLENDSSHFAHIITSEVGKPLKESITEVKKCQSLCDHYLENLNEYLEDKQVTTSSQFSIHQKGSGIILGIMPWNFPFWQVFRLAIPSILAGNTVVLKHAPNTPLCALEIENIFSKALPDFALYRNLFVDIPALFNIISDQRVRGVSLTGSEAAGRSVYQIAAQFLKPCVLELGSNDPFIVFEDADIEMAAKEAVSHRLRNTGQSCIAPKRILVQKSVQDQFIASVLQVFDVMKMGNPLEHVDLGTLAKHEFVSKAQRQVNDSIQEGAVLLSKIEAPKNSICFSPAWVIKNVMPNMPLFVEEVFAPVVAITEFEDCNHAISLSNQSNYGLGASVWTHSEPIFQQMVKHLDFGLIFQNEAVFSSPGAPFGGVKNSGIGKELGEDGIRAFSNRVTVFKA